MIKTLDVILTKDLNDQPMGLVCQLPGGYAEMSPTDMRNLARVLNKAARDCEAQPNGPRSNRPEIKQYDLAPDAVADIPGMLPVIYLCGDAGMGKTWIAQGLKKQREADGRNHSVVIVDTGDDITLVDMQRANDASPGNSADLVVCWGAGQAEDFPVKPCRVIRIGRD